MKRKESENAGIDPACGNPCENPLFSTMDMRLDSYEDWISSCQDLTFLEAEKEFLLHGVPFGPGEKRGLGLLDRRGRFTNLALLLSDQCPFSIREATFGRDDIFSRSHERREFSGSLFRQMKEANDFLDFRNMLYCEIHGLYRVERRDYPKEAVREGIMNAIVHRDYSIPTFSKIALFQDRIEILSAGGLPPGADLEEVLQGRSCPRNPCLRDIFRRLGLIEASGTGIPRIRRSYERATRKPFFRMTKNTFLLVLPNRNHPLESPVEEDESSFLP